MWNSTGLSRFPTLAIGIFAFDQVAVWLSLRVADNKPKGSYFIVQQGIY